jgi:hypothetical protein
MVRNLGKFHVLKHKWEIKLIDCELLIVPRGHEMADEPGCAKCEGIHIVCGHPIHKVCFAHRTTLRFCLRWRLQKKLSPCEACLRQIPATHQCTSSQAMSHIDLSIKYNGCHNTLAL